MYYSAFYALLLILKEKKKRVYGYLYIYMWAMPLIFSTGILPVLSISRVLVYPA